MAAIQQAITFGYFCAAAGGVVTLALAYDAIKMRGFRFTLPAAAVMLLIHPAWTVSAIHGDCGSMKIQASMFFTAVYFGFIIFQYVVSRRAV
jgi:hypothetical protein